MAWHIRIRKEYYVRFFLHAAANWIKFIAFRRRQRTSLPFEFMCDVESLFTPYANAFTLLKTSVNTQTIMFRHSTAEAERELLFTRCLHFFFRSIHKHRADTKRFYMLISLCKKRKTKLKAFQEWKPQRKVFAQFSVARHSWLVKCEDIMRPELSVVCTYKANFIFYSLSSRKKEIHNRFLVFTWRASDNVDGFSHHYAIVKIELQSAEHVDWHSVR